jgi:hypothetical protein
MYLLCDRQGQRIRYHALNDRFNKARGDASGSSGTSAPRPAPIHRI